MPGLSLPRRPKSADGARPSHLYLRIERTLYAVSPLACDPTIAIKAFRLGKPDGTLYDVSQTKYGNLCDCPDFIFRRDGLDPSGCKHIKALVRQGVLDHPESSRGKAGPGRGVALRESRA